MDRVVAAASAVGASVLVTVTPWRSELQVWRGGEQLRVLAWQAGTVGGLDSDEAVAAAADLASLEDGVDRPALARQLAGPRPGVDAWRDVVAVLGLPLPEGFPELADDELAPGEGSVVHAGASPGPAAGPRADEEALSRAPRLVAAARATAVVAGAAGCWLSVSMRSWAPLVGGVVVVAAAIALVGFIGSGRGPGRPPTAG
jgi:hypothetical protein